MHPEEEFHPLFSDNDVCPDLRDLKPFIYSAEKTMKRIIALSTIFFAFFLSAARIMAADMPDNPTIRVLIADNKDFIPITLKGKYTISAVGTDKVVSEGPFLNVRVCPIQGGLRLGEKAVAAPGIKIRVARDANIYVDSRRFRGGLDIVRKADGRLMAINYIGLEEYLYGVLYHEISHRWPMEAIKAQAVAARTFALNQIGQSKLAPYDVTCDIYSQVYGGRTSEKWSTNRAVDVTRGQVLTYKAGIFPAYYHAACAGRTEDASNLWKTNIEPLKGVSCDFCRASPHYRWTKVIPLTTLEARLKESGYKTGGIASVSVLGKNTSGRADKVEIRGDGGVSVILTGKDFRQIIGPNDLRSAKFDVCIKGKNLFFEGYGWGHGAGMCQWGALGMAKKGKRYDEILKYYYPGSEIKSIDSARPKT
jgi:stage II sporulation protein D